MDAGDVITDFELQVSDMTELSSDEELRVLNRVRRKINRRPLEANRTPYTGTLSTTVPYISLPTDFFRMASNYDYAHADHDGYGNAPVVLVGSSNSPVKVIPYADRNRYVNNARYAYLDIVNKRLVFCLQPVSADSAAFDYYALPADFTSTSQSDWITTNFPDALVYGMACEDFIVQLSDKARSYLPENTAKFRDEIGEIASWNLSLVSP